MDMPAVFDRQHFDHMTGADQALQLELLAIFREQAETWAVLLSPERSIDTWRDAAHSMKGTARGLGFWALGEACDGAEKLGKSDNPAPAAVDAALARARAALIEALDAMSQGEAPH